MRDKRGSGGRPYSTLDREEAHNKETMIDSQRQRKSMLTDHDAKSAVRLNLSALGNL